MSRIIETTIRVSAFALPRVLTGRAAMSLPCKNALLRAAEVPRAAFVGSSETGAVVAFGVMNVNARLASIRNEASLLQDFLHIQTSPSAKKAGRISSSVECCVCGSDVAGV